MCANNIVLNQIIEEPFFRKKINLQGFLINIKQRWFTQAHGRQIK